MTSFNIDEISEPHVISTERILSGIRYTTYIMSGDEMRKIYFNSVDNMMDEDCI